MSRIYSSARCGYYRRAIALFPLVFPEHRGYCIHFIAQPLKTTYYRASRLYHRWCALLGCTWACIYFLWLIFGYTPAYVYVYIYTLHVTSSVDVCVVTIAFSPTHTIEVVIYIHALGARSFPGEMDQILNENKRESRKKGTKRKHVCVFVCVLNAVASRSAAHTRSSCTVADTANTS